MLIIYYRQPIGDYFHEIARQQEEKDRWFNEHCKKAGKKEGQFSIGVGPNIGGEGGVAVVPVFTPDQDIFQCDDGQIIIK